MTARDRLREIGVTSRQALATRPTELDSWLNAYRDDVPALLDIAEAAEHLYGALCRDGLSDFAPHENESADAADRLVEALARLGGGGR